MPVVTQTTASADQARREAARRQLQADQEFEEKEAQRRKTQANIQVGVSTDAAPAPEPAAAPKAAAPSKPAAPSIGSAATALRGRGIEAMGEKYGFRNGTPFVEGPAGVDKVDAKLTRGEAVLPAETVAALGGPDAIAHLIKVTTGRNPQRGGKKIRAFIGYSPEEEALQEKNASVIRDWRDNKIDLTPVNDAYKSTPASMAPAPAASTTAAAQPTYMQRYYPETARVFNESGPDITKAYKKGGVGAAAGMTARKAVSYFPAVASDIAGNVRAVIDPAAQAAKTFFTGDAAPIATAAAASPVAADANYGIEGRRPTYGELGTAGARTSAPAVTGPFGPAANTASMGGKTRTYTPEELQAMSGGGDMTNVRSPMEIYSNEMLLNRAYPNVPKGGVISNSKYGLNLGGNGYDEGADKATALFSASQRGQGTEALKMEAARQAVADKQRIAELQTAILKAKTPEERRGYIETLMAYSGKSPSEQVIKLRGPTSVDPLTGAKTEGAEIGINATTGQQYNPFGAATAAPAASPYQDGQTLRGKDGKLYVVKNGQPVPKD